MGSIGGQERDINGRVTEKVTEVREEWPQKN
jgi:hypothetical protein